MKDSEIKTGKEVIIPSSEDDLESRLLRLRDDQGSSAEDEVRALVLSELIPDCCWARWTSSDNVSERLWVNDGLLGLTGYTPQEYVHVGRENLVHPDDLEFALQYVDGPLGLSEFEYRIIRKDGEVRWVHERMRVVGRDKSFFSCGVSRDVTEQKQVELDLRAALQELESTQNQLVQTGKLAALGELCAGIAHELSQPLTAISILAERLVSKDASVLPDTAVEDLAIVVEQSKRMATILDNLRAFSRRRQSDMALVDAWAPVGDALTLIAQQLRLESVAVEIVELSKGAFVSADRAQLQQVFLNLLTNALHALQDTEESHERLLWLRSEIVGEKVKYVVEDNGGGVPGDLRDQIFNPFFTTKEAGTGTGLGLSLAYGIIHEHGGDIEYEDGATGARFVVSLPIGKQVVDRLPLQDAASPDRIPGSYRVLVVDDEALIRSLLERIVTSWGWQVTTAGSGDRALELIASDRFDLLVLDVKMPGMSGLELIEQARELSESVPIVVISGYVSPADRERLKSLDVAADLRKPVPIDKLKEALSAAVLDRPADRLP